MGGIVIQPQHDPIFGTVDAEEACSSDADMSALGQDVFDLEGGFHVDPKDPYKTIRVPVSVQGSLDQGRYERHRATLGMVDNGRSAKGMIVIGPTFEHAGVAFGESDGMYLGFDSDKHLYVIEGQNNKHLRKQAGFGLDPSTYRIEDGKIRWVTKYDKEGEALGPQNVGQAAYDALFAYIDSRDGVGSHHKKVTIQDTASLYDFHRTEFNSQIKSAAAGQEITFTLSDTLVSSWFSGADDAASMVALVRFGFLKDAKTVDIMNQQVTFATAEAAESFVKKLFGVDKRTMLGARSDGLANGAQVTTGDRLENIDQTYTTPSGGGLHFWFYEGEQVTTSVQGNGIGTQDNVIWSIAAYDDVRHAVDNPVETPEVYDGLPPLDEVPEERRHSGIILPILVPDESTEPVVYDKAPELFTSAARSVTGKSPMEDFQIPPGWRLPTAQELANNFKELSIVKVPDKAGFHNAPFTDEYGREIHIEKYVNFYTVRTPHGNLMPVVLVELPDEILEKIAVWWSNNKETLKSPGVLISAGGVLISAGGVLISAGIGLTSIAISIALIRTIRKQSAPLSLDQKKEIFDKATSDFRTEWRQGYDASAPKIYPDIQGVRDFDPRAPGASADSLFPGFDPSQPLPHVDWGIARTTEVKKLADTILIQSGNLNTANPASMLLEAIGGQGKDWIMIGLAQSVEMGRWPDGSALEGDYRKLMDREKFPILKFKPKALMEGGQLVTVQSTTIQAFIDQYEELLRQGKFPLLYWPEIYRTWREGDVNQSNLRAEGIGSALIEAMGDGRMMLVGTGAPADRDKVTADLQSTKGGQAVQVFGRLAKVYGETGLPELNHAELAASVYMELARFCYAEGIEYDHNALLATAKELVEVTKTELPGMGLGRAARQLTDEFKTFLKGSKQQAGFCVNFDTYASSKKNRPSPGVAAQIQRIREATSTLAEREYTTEELRLEVADLQRRGILAADFKLDTAIGEFLNGLGIRTDSGGNATERPAQQLSRIKLLAAYLEHLVQVTESVLPEESQIEIRRTLIAIYMHGTDALNLSPQGQIGLAVDLQTMQLRRRSGGGGNSGGSSGTGFSPPPSGSPPPAPRNSAPPGSSASATSAATFIPKLTLTELAQIFPQLRQPFANPQIAVQAITQNFTDAQRIIWKQRICPEGVPLPQSSYEIAARLQKVVGEQNAEMIFARSLFFCQSSTISSPALGVMLMNASVLDPRSLSDPARAAAHAEQIIINYERLIKEKRGRGEKIEEEVRRAEAWRRELERQKQQRERAVAVPL